MQKQNKLLKQQLKISARETSESAQIQTSKLVKSFVYDDRKAILEQANIQPSEIIAEEMVVIKVDFGTPWETMKTMGMWETMMTIGCLNKFY